jgi:hypothetical protein
MTHEHSSGLAPYFGRRASWLLLLLVAAGALAAVFVPAYLILPFKSQTPRGLEISYALRRWSPVGTALALVAALVLAVRLWALSRRWWSKAALVLPLAVVILAAWFARQNHFEWMFKPLPQPAFTAAVDAKDLADTDRVMAIEVNGDAVAYPIRYIGYHHVVQAAVGGRSVVATY